ncbi:siderophore-interacting protein [Paracoccus sp. Z330]|uniref:Siderophore-interacting protein n=1 Tax=Paracoccus onchidii TaxID=3017813 RepID=A0ABT4ZEA9_9RHOB|nr:siderophore-interacting protein [Paracoccus onchidii]MDB6177682.1 siderophore-interacting protein [Paracoccus onchidii]
MKQARPAPRLLTVTEARHITPNMIRVTFGGPELEGLPEGRESANCKLMLPEINEDRAAFLNRLSEGPAPIRRTYTVRHHWPDRQELVIDFVDHGDNGPASAWARAAKPGAFLAFNGPGPVKVQHFEADFYVLAADMSALPMAAAVLEAMPRDAKGVAFFEITSPEDQQLIDAPAGVAINWLLHPQPHNSSGAMLHNITSMDWPEGRVQICIAGEHGAIATLRKHLLVERGLDRGDCYISGYWKIGLVEDEHQALKRTEAA